MKLKDVVKEIPTNVKDIIKFLHKHKIKGRKGSPYDCPISRYIASRGIRNVSVSRLAICSPKKTIATPKHILYFINLFELGKIPSLVIETEGSELPTTRRKK